MDNVGDAGDVGVALLDDAESQDGEVRADNAAADTLPLALTSTTGTVAGVALAEEEAHTGRMHNTLLHREALIVVAAGDAEDVALELVANAVAQNLLTHATVHEDVQLAVVLDLDQLLRAIVGVRNVELHLDGVSRCAGAATLVDCRSVESSRLGLWAIIYRSELGAGYRFAVGSRANFTPMDPTLDVWVSAVQNAS